MDVQNVFVVKLPDVSAVVLARFSDFLYAKCGLAKASVDLKMGYIKRSIPTLGIDPSIDDILRHVTQYRTGGAKHGSVCNLVSALNRFSTFLGRPLQMRMPRAPRRIITNVLSEAEVVRIVDAAKTLREKALVALLAYTGCRNAEICGLRIRDVDITNCMISVEEAKGGAARRVCITPGCMDVVSKYLVERNGQPDDLLFQTIRWHHPLATQDLRKIIRTMAGRTGIDKRVWPHLFRHSLATSMLHRGAGVLTIKDQLGHAFVESTMLYVHSSQERLQVDYRAFAPCYL